MKHTNTRSKIVAICATGLLGMSLLAVPAFADPSMPTPPTADVDLGLPRADATHGGGSGTSKPADAPNPKPDAPAGTQNNNGKNNSQNQNNQKKDNERKSNSSTHRNKRSKDSSSRSAENKAKAETKKAAEEGVKAAEELGGVITSKTAPVQSGVTVSQVLPTKTVTPASGERLGFTGNAPAGASELEWGSNTPGYWWTSPWFPIGMGSGVAVLIVGTAAAAIMRTRYAHQEELAEMEGGLGITGTYVAPLVPEIKPHEADDTSMYMALVDEMNESAAPATVTAPAEPAVSTMTIEPSEDFYKANQVAQVAQDEKVETFEDALKVEAPEYATSEYIRAELDGGLGQGAIDPDDTSVYLRILEEEDAREGHQN